MSGQTHLHGHPQVVSAFHLAVRARVRLIAVAAAGPVVLVLAVGVGLAVDASLLVVAIAVPVVAVLAVGWWRALSRARAASVYYRSGWELTRSVVEQVDRDLAEAHRRALEVADDQRERGAGFVLLLRSFEPEAQRWLTPEGTGSHGATRNVITSLRGASGAVETEIARLVGDRPIVCVANPNALNAPPTGAVAARLQLPNEGWLPIVSDLIGAAHMIVFDLVVFAPGVEAELDAISAAGRADDALVVLPPPESADLAHVNTFRELAELQGAPPGLEAVSLRDHAALAGLPHVLEWGTVPADDAALRAYLEPRLRSLDGANALAENRRAVDCIDHGEYEQARSLLDHALELARRSGDAAAEATTYGNLGVVYGDGLGDSARALEAHEQSLRLYGSVHDDEGVRRERSALALLHMEAGDDGDALRFLLG